MKQVGRRYYVRQGFTLVELVIVIAVITILAAITTVAYNSAGDKAVVTKIKSDLQAWATELNSNRNFDTAFPATVDHVADEGYSYSYHQWLDGKTFCLDMVYDKNQAIQYYYDESERSVKEGQCGEAPEDETSPGGGQVATSESCFDVSFAGSAYVIVMNYHGKANMYGTASIDPSCPLDVVIPEYISGYPVFSFAGTAFQNKGITSVILPRQVNNISAGSFTGNNFTAVTIPNSSAYVQPGAFDSKVTITYP